MKIEFKTLLWILGIIIILSLIPIAILFYQNNKLQSDIAEYAGDKQVDYKTITDSLQRAETKIAKNNEELIAFSYAYGIDIKNIQSDLQDLNAQLEAVSSTTARTNTIIYTNKSSDTKIISEVEVPTCPSDGRPIDIHGYTKKIETKYLEDSNGMRIADISFSAAEKNPWRSTIYGINYTINNTIGRTEKGQIILTTELLAENPSVNPGKRYNISGVTSRTLQAPPAPTKFSWWDPYLYLNASIALGVYQEVNFSAGISLGFSFFSYGENWRFLVFTLGYDAFQNSFRVSFIPVLYNLGGPLPFLSDLWLGLDVGISHTSNISIGLIIGTTI